MTSVLLTLPELAEAAARAVEATGARPENRQAKAVPAVRMIRYYTARGLLAPPGTRGRALVYGRRHLLQLVAIKKLQSRGRSLEEIAERLTGLSDADLEGLAGVPGEALPAGLGDVDPGQSNQARATQISRRAERFWDRAATADAPGSSAPAAPMRLRASSRALPAGDGPPERPPGERARILTELRLSDTVRLLVDGEPSGLPSLEELLAAAAPLLQLLATNPPAPDRKEPS
ncbi:MAG: MerR family transcriptional regulator [Acidimicrobiales bacterium]|nr:MerR family transcriptional regulator [Acidimicrobiales bacterium]